MKSPATSPGFLFGVSIQILSQEFVLQNGFHVAVGVKRT